jgi:molybdenum cofactor biosynthesis enzyme MoaA
MAIKAVARIMANLIMENIKGAKTEATEARIMVEGHPSIHTSFASLIKRKDTMSLSAEKLHEIKMATMAMATATMAMAMAKADLGRVDQSLISRILLNLSLTLRIQ